MKILLVHADKYPWATTYRAEELKKHWVNDEVDIKSKFEPLDGEPYDIIHILFSGGMRSIKDFILKNKDKTFTSLASLRTLDNVYDTTEDLKEIYSSTRGTVCLNSSLLKALGELLGDSSKLCYIPNGVDPELFNKEFVVGVVSYWDDRVEKHKGVDLVIQACDELGVRVISPALVAFEEMPKFYSQIDCFVLASESEGCNNPTLEALAMCKPVISTGVGIANELEGVTIVDRNVESIKEAIRKINGRIQILESYTWDIIAGRYRDLYVEK